VIAALIILLSVASAWAGPKQGDGAFRLISKPTPVKTNAVVAVSPLSMMALPAAAAVPTVRRYTNYVTWSHSQMGELAGFTVYQWSLGTNLLATNYVGMSTTNKVVRTNALLVTVRAIGTNSMESPDSNFLRLPPPPKTNLVVHVTTTGTNIYWSSLTVGGAWTSAGTTNLWQTNSPTRYFRSKGKAGNVVKIEQWYE